MSGAVEINRAAESNTRLLEPDRYSWTINSPATRYHVYILGYILNESTAVALTAMRRPYLHDGIEGRVCPDTQICAGHIVTYGGGQHTHRDAKLLIGSASLIQLQQTLKRLKRQDVKTRQSCGRPEATLFCFFSF